MLLEAAHALISSFNPYYEAGTIKTPFFRGENLTKASRGLSKTTGGVQMRFKFMQPGYQFHALSCPVGSKCSN